MCGFATVYGYALAAHKRSVHEKAKDFPCELCDYATHTKNVGEIPEMNRYRFEISILKIIL